MSSPALLSTAGLAVGYRRRDGPFAVLDGVRESLRSGELVCVLGPNGAGKSTLLRTLAGLQPPLGGRIDLLGRDLASYPPRRRAREIGVVLPERPRAGLLTAASLVALGRYPYTDWTGRLTAADEDLVRGALAQVGAARLADRDVLALSDGELQRVMIARALAQEPTLLVLDEPTAFLDLPGRVEIMGLLRALAHRPQDGPRTQARAVVLSTHDLELALRSADRLWLITGGTLLSGAPEDLVLSGAFQSVWQSEEARFDVHTGSWRLAHRGSGTAVVRGGGPAAFWTRRALERVGFEVVEAGAELVVEVASGENVTAGDRRGGSWRWRRGADRGRATSVAALLDSLSR